MILSISDLDAFKLWTFKYLLIKHVPKRSEGVSHPKWKVKNDIDMFTKIYQKDPLLYCTYSIELLIWHFWNRLSLFKRVFWKCIQVILSRRLKIVLFIERKQFILVNIFTFHLSMCVVYQNYNNLCIWSICEKGKSPFEKRTKNHFKKFTNPRREYGQLCQI